MLVIPTLALGGAERIAADLGNRLPGPVCLALFNTEAAPAFPHVGELVNLDLPSSATTLRRAVNAVNGIRQLRRAKRAHRVGTTVGFMEAASILAVLSRTSDRVVVTARTVLSQTTWPGLLANSIYRRAISFAYRRADVIVANSKGVADDLVWHFGLDAHNICVIYNSCDALAVRRSSEVAISTAAADLFRFPVVITVGRLAEAKGQWALLRAFKLCRERVPDAKLVIIGDGELKDALVALSNGLGFRTNVGPAEPLSADYDVYFPGAEANPFPYIARAALFVLSSVQEGFPNVLVEAMACGVPVVSTDCRSGPREILAPQTSHRLRCTSVEYAEYGILVPPPPRAFAPADAPLSEAEVHLTTAMCDALGCRALADQYGARARARSADFGLEGAIQEWQRVIRS